MMTGWSSTKFVIFVPIGNPRWQPQGDLVKRLVEDHPVIISIMLQFHRLSSFWQEDLQSFNQSEHIIAPGDFRSNLFIFVWIRNPKWPSPGDFFYHWTLWEFHWKTFLWETTQQIEFFALYESILDFPSATKKKKLGRGPPSHHSYNVTIPFW
jgi:hypothetical protein